ncbi:MAG: hypothetical protein KAH99_03255, partial [Verrucomicrobia bacterium]|nr:hypothetical protein [Verrucomicrobiota bacterium]
QGASSGWINYDLVKQGVLPPAEAAGKLDEHMYAFGGEERFWMGPEGGQYSIFFAPGKPFEFADWFTPDPIDNEPWAIASKSKNEVAFKTEFALQNHSGTRFDVGVERTVMLLDKKQVGKLLGTSLPSSLDFVAYQTLNTVVNKGDAAWEPESGLLSIWMLCMFQPSPSTTVFIPYKQGAEADLGNVVNADYFGVVPPERLQAEGGVIYFKTDGTQRGKIGVTPQRSTGVVGSYDPVAQRMTLLITEPPKDYFGYVNSMWELQDEPFKGDALNSYNDGPVDESGDQMGPFYEMESSSPALALNPGETATHTQCIIHLYGDEEKLQAVLSAIAPIELAKVKTALLQP